MPLLPFFVQIRKVSSSLVVSVFVVASYIGLTGRSLPCQPYKLERVKPAPAVHSPYILYPCQDLTRQSCHMLPLRPPPPRHTPNKGMLHMFVCSLSSPRFYCRISALQAKDGRKRGREGFNPLLSGKRWLRLGSRQVSLVSWRY